MMEVPKAKQIRQLLKNWIIISISRIDTLLSLNFSDTDIAHFMQLNIRFESAQVAKKLQKVKENKCVSDQTKRSFMPLSVVIEMGLMVMSSDCGWGGWGSNPVGANL